jgi:hypothetical protein
MTGWIKKCIHFLGRHEVPGSNLHCERVFKSLAFLSARTLYDFPEGTQIYAEFVDLVVKALAGNSQPTVGRCHLSLCFAQYVNYIRLLGLIEELFEWQLVI